MPQSENKIKCPNCGTSIDVNSILSHELESEIRKKYTNYLNAEKKKHEATLAQMDKDRVALAKEKENLQASIEDGIHKKLKEERQNVESRIRKQLSEEQSDRMQILEKEIEDKSTKLKEYNKALAQVEQLKREKETLRDEIKLESEKEITDQINKEKIRIQKALDDKNELRIKEKDHVIQQLNTQLKDAQLKAQQGSMQIQGEVLELAIEEWLQSQFPLDTIEEIKKGVRGADCVQIVNTRVHQNCGSIYYESKRTKDFQAGWIEKFKVDMRNRNASIGVLVTEAMPKDMERMGMKDGVWVCTFDEFKGLCHVLRESVVQINNAVATQENKGDKMVMLYDYLISNEFRMQIEAIVEGFTEMQSELVRERRAMEGIWKRREKQIQKVVLNTTHMFQSVKGIAGNAIAPVRALEIEVDEDLFTDDKS